jgi:hypothetical protein
MTLTRRRVLQGAGATLGLPWLEAYAGTKPGSTVPGKAPVRMAALYMPNGTREDMWTPAKTGREFELTPTLEPLKDVKNDILVLTNLWNANSKGGDGHYVKISGWLTCTTVTKTLGVDVSCNGISMDQLAAQRTGKLTPLPSLELGVSPVTTGVDKNVGYTRVYGSHIAWAGPTLPLAREIDPVLVFERLFRAHSPQSNRGKHDKLLLDRVLEDAKVLRTQLGAADRHRVDEYLSVVRSLEERIERTNRPSENPWKPRAPISEKSKPSLTPQDFAEHVRLMMDMIALSFQTDTTRIATFLFGNEVTNQSFAFLDTVKEGHHSLSHHERNEEKLRQYQLVGQWHVAEFAYLLNRLKAMPEGEGTVLDNSLILFGSGIRDGNKHDPHNLPVVLGGRGGGRLDAGQHLSYTPDTPLANLYVSMLDAFGTPVERFADSTGPLAGVLA